jgi:hypothetical protein
MNKAWKKFTIIISVLLCIMIVCLSINLVFDKLTGNMLSPVRDNNSVSDNYGGQQNGGNYNTLPNGNNGQTPDNNPGVTPSTPDASQQNTVPSQQQANQNSENPLTYSKSQLIAYYNSCLKKSYAQPKVNATKTEVINVVPSQITIGSSGFDVDQLASALVESNTKGNNQLQAKTFSNGRAGDGTDITKFVLPANLYDGAVKSISASKNGDGYKIVIKLNQESCSINGVARYNASCAWPLDIGMIDFGALGGAVTVNEGTFKYTGTTITAIIDSQGRVTDTVVDMPLTVTGIKAIVDFKITKVDVGVGLIDGNWSCHNTMSF